LLKLIISPHKQGKSVLSEINHLRPSFTNPNGGSLLNFRLLVGSSVSNFCTELLPVAPQEVSERNLLDEEADVALLEDFDIIWKKSCFNAYSAVILS
jgi:hypothetical protein